MSRLQRLLRNEDGPVAVEYAVMLALIIAVCIAGISLVGGGTVDYWENNDDKIGNAMNHSAGTGS